MRVIAGSARGRRLAAPPGRGTRPTSDRVREALFSSLRDVVTGARVLDLFAGSGALGIEALSRGAAHAVFVERDPRALTAIRRNLAAAGVGERAAVIGGDAAVFARRPRGGPFTLVLADPPYETPDAEVYGLLATLREHGALAPGARLVLERDRRAAAGAPPEWLAHERTRTYGDTMLRYLRTEDV